MKQLFFAGSFAILAFIAYGVKGNSHDFSGKNATLSFLSINDTTPKLDTNPHMKKKKYGKDSTMKKDTLHPLKDSTNR
jgi:hypothetical protein